MITEGFASRKMVSAPGYFKAGQPVHYDPKLVGPGEIHPKKKTTKFEEVLKFNPYRDEEGNYTTKERDAGQRAMSAGMHTKDAMRIEGLTKHGPKALARAGTMARSITTFEKAHRRANAAEAAKQPEMAKIFRDRAKALGAGAITAARRAGLPLAAAMVKPSRKPPQAMKKIAALYGGRGDRSKTLEGTGKESGAKTTGKGTLTGKPAARQNLAEQPSHVVMEGMKALLKGKKFTYGGKTYG